MKAAVTALAGLILAFPLTAPAHTIPDDLAIQIWAKAEGPRFRLLIRVPLDAFADTQFPIREAGDLELGQAESMLPDAASTWISDWVDVYEGNRLLAKPRIAETRVSLSSDNSFASYGEALGHLTGARLPGVMSIAPNQAMVDVLLDYPIRSEQSSFAIHSRLARLAVRVVTLLRFVPPGGELRTYGFAGDPGFFRLDPPRSDALKRFVSLGFSEFVNGHEYLLFLFCTALWLRRAGALFRFAAMFAAASSVTLMGSAFNAAPDAVWFPVLFETLVALSIVYVALDAIVVTTPGRRWPFACGFGLIFGFAFSFGLRPGLQFGGSHLLVSVLSFLAGLAVAQFGILTLLALALHTLFRLGVPERLATIFMAALAAHTGWHRMLDRAQWLMPALTSTGPVAWSAERDWLIAALMVASVLVWGYKTRAWRMTASHFSRIRRATS